MVTECSQFGVDEHQHDEAGELQHPEGEQQDVEEVRLISSMMALP